MPASQAALQTDLVLASVKLQRSPVTATLQHLLGSGKARSLLRGRPLCPGCRGGGGSYKRAFKGKRLVRSQFGGRAPSTLLAP